MLHQSAASKNWLYADMTKPVLLETGPMMDLISSQLAAHFTVHKLHETNDREALFAKIGPELRAICTGGHTGVKTDTAMLARFPKLKVIGNFGVGYDSIDIPTASKRGIIDTELARLVHSNPGIRPIVELKGVGKAIATE